MNKWPFLNAWLADTAEAEVLLERLALMVITVIMLFGFLRLFWPSALKYARSLLFYSFYVLTLLFMVTV
jgi:hypothetical protein